MSIIHKRKIIESLDLLDQPIKFNPFVFSRMFFLWAFLGIIGGREGNSLHGGWRLPKSTSRVGRDSMKEDKKRNYLVLLPC